MKPARNSREVPRPRAIRARGGCGCTGRWCASGLFEEQVNELYTRALMPGLAHLYIGEEAIAVGICEALRAGRLHHQHASRPWPLPGQGRSP